MYTIKCDDVLIHDPKVPDTTYRVLSPNLSLEDNAAGSLTMTLPVGSIGYNTVKKITSRVKVYRDGTEIWEGRVLSEDSDFWKNRVLTLEGELAYLNDSHQPPNEYKGTIRNFLTSLLTVHNNKVSADKQFTLGTVTVTDPNDFIYRFTNYENTLQAIQEKLVERLGGHLRVRKSGTTRYLDYLAEYPRTSSQIIRFGENLLDYSNKFDMSDICTVVIPRGARLENSPIPQLEAYTTVASVNSGSIYVQNSTAVNKYGWIEKVVDWNDVTVPSNLLTKAMAYLTDQQFEDMEIEIKAVDLHHMDINTEALQMLDQVRCISEPHGLDKFFPIRKMDIPLDDPGNTTYGMGVTVKQGFTTGTNAKTTQLQAYIDEKPSPQVILEEAKDNSTSLINQFVNGYVSLIKTDNYGNELYISDTPDPKNATKLWRWNLNGLAYSSNGYDGTYKTAITSDGRIVADFITTGTMSAERILGGILKLGNYSGKDGIIEMFNSSGTRYGRWDKDALYIGNISGSDLTSPSFKVNADELALQSTSSTSWNYRARIGLSGASAYLSTSAYNASGTYQGNCAINYQSVQAHNSQTNTTGNAFYMYSSRLTASDRGVFVLEIGGSTFRFSEYVNSNTYRNWAVGSPTSITLGSSNKRMSFYVYQGSKSKVVKTKDYGDRALYCYEMPTPMFGDIGDGVISEDGRVYIFIENIFGETIADTKYQVFLQKCGPGDCWVSDKTLTYFVVEGTPGLAFSWELKAKQIEYEQVRLANNYDEEEKKGINGSIKYDTDFQNHVINLQQMRKELLNDENSN